MPQHVENFLSAYIDGELNDEERRKVDEHLQLCGACSSVLSDLSRQKNLVYEAFHEAEIPDFADKVVLALQREEQAVRERKAVPYLALTALIGILILVYVIPVPFKLLGIFTRLFVHMVYAGAGMLMGELFWALAVGGSAFILLLVSGISLRRLLRTRTV